MGVLLGARLLVFKALQEALTAPRTDLLVNFRLELDEVTDECVKVKPFMYLAYWGSKVKEESQQG